VVLKLGSRGSALAVAQATLVAESLRKLGEDVEMVTITTSGDERPGGAPAPEIDDKARFVKEIEQALIDGRIDLAVHSAKDVPGELADGLAIAGVPARADARDSLCGAESLGGLAEGAVVGTASLRRRAQLLALRPDLEVRDLRGNVDTRLRRLEEEDYDAIVLAAAGLARLGRDEGAPLPEAEMTPAPGQGCLVLETRSGDAAMRDLAAELTERDALVCLTAERALVAGLAASCTTPVGAHATVAGQTLTVEAFAGMPDGSAWVRDAIEGPADSPADLGREAAQRMVAAGARDVLDAAERAVAAEG
jgi:hydroxymethylbilane synthase